MATEQLYDLAFQYKKTKLWKKLYDSNIFVVRLENGENGYCCVMGRSGEFNALAVYVGERAFAVYQYLMASDDESSVVGLMQTCLQCQLTNREDLTPEQEAEVRAYAKANGIRFAGANAFPAFVKATPYHIPWPTMDAQDEHCMEEALRAALYVAARLEKGTTLAQMGFCTHGMTSEMPLPLLTPAEDGAYTLSMMPQPVMEDHLPPIPHPAWNDEVTARRIKTLRRSGSEWQTALLILPEPIQEAPEKAPVFPHVLLAVEANDGMIVSSEVETAFEEHPEHCAQNLAAVMQKRGERPTCIKTANQLTYSLLESFCKAVGIRLTVQESLPELLEAAEAMMERFSGPDPTMDEIEAFPDEVLDMLPETVVREFFQAERMGDTEIPQSFLKRLHRLFPHL